MRLSVCMFKGWCMYMYCGCTCMHVGSMHGILVCGYAGAAMMVLYARG